MSISKMFNRSYRDYVHDSETMRTLNIIILSVAVGMFLFSIQGGVAFVGFASALGAGEFAFGLISALPVLAGLLQLFVSYVAVKTEKYKTMFLVGGVIQRVAWIVIAFIPYLFPVGESSLWLLITLVTLAAMAGSFVGIPHTTLMGSIIPIEVRGRYIAARQRVMMAVGLFVGLGVAFVLDNIEGYLGYTIVFAVGGVAGLIDILMYAGVRFSIVSSKSVGFSFAKVMKACFTSPITRNYLLFWMVWSFVINLSAPFINKYAIDKLEFSYTSMIIFGQIIAQSLSLIVVSRWGRLIDRYGSAPVLLIAVTSFSIGSFAWLFAVPGNLWPLIIANTIGGITWCAHDACMANMQLSHTPSEGRPAALSIYAVVTSIAAASALIIGGAALEILEPVMDRLELTFAGTPFDNYKLVITVGGILRFAVIAIFIPMVWNEKGLKLREAYKMMFENTRMRWRIGLARFKHK